MTKIYTTDGRAVKREIEVPPRGSCMLDVDTGKGFLPSAANLFEHDAQSWQILFESSCMPLGLRQPVDTETMRTLTNQIARDNLNEAEAQQYKAALRHALIDKLVWIVAMVCIVVLIFGAMAYIKKPGSAAVTPPAVQGQKK